jgi:hypothetical protein
MVFRVTKGTCIVKDICPFNIYNMLLQGFFQAIFAIQWTKGLERNNQDGQQPEFKNQD